MRLHAVLAAQPGHEDERTWEAARFMAGAVVLKTAIPYIKALATAGIPSGYSMRGSDMELRDRWMLWASLPCLKARERSDQPLHVPMRQDSRLGSSLERHMRCVAPP